MKTQFFNRITYYWTKAHAGTRQNEEVDKLAKEATDYAPPTNHPLSTPKSAIKRQLKQIFYKQWEEEWRATHKGRRTKDFIKSLHKYPRILTRAITRFVTGHGPFASYLKRFGLRPSELCPCGSGEVGDPQHYMFKCCLTKEFHFRETRDHLNYMIMQIAKHASSRQKLDNLYKVLENLFAV